MKNFVAVIVFLALGGLGVWLWLDSSPKVARDSEVGPPATIEIPAKARADADGSSSARVESDRKAIANSTGGEQPRKTEAPRLDPAAIPVAAWPSAGWLLQVVDDATQQPVEGALVWGLVTVEAGWRSNVFALHEFVDQGLDHLDAVCAAEPAYRTDADGFVRLPETAQEVVLAVRAGARRAIGFSNSGSERNTQLAVRLSQDQLIEVVDPRGQAVVGAQIDLNHMWLSIPTGRKTDAAGQLVLHAVNTALLSANELLFPDKADSLLVSLMPSANATAQLLAPEPIRFVLENCADVDVRLVGVKGGAWHGSREVELKCGRVKLRSTADNTGIARFHGLPIGSEVEASLWIAFTGASDDVLPANGIVGADGLHLELHGVSNRAEVSMRLLNPKGAPLADQEVLVELELRSKQSGAAKAAKKSATRMTDTSGVLTHGFNDVEDELPENHRMDVVLTATVDGETLAAVLPPLLGPASFPHDYGNVMLTPHEPLVAGRVVTERGSPVAGAWVDLLEKVTPTLLRNVEGYGSVLTDSDGRFSLDGRRPEGEALMRAQMSGYGRSQLTLFQAGEQHVELVLERMGSIVTSLAPGVSAEGLRVRINPVDPDLKLEFSPQATGRVFSNQSGFHGEFDDLGEMTWTGLWPGTYQLQLVMEGQTEALIEWPEIVVQSGLLTRDAEMQNIDLSNFLHHVVIHVTNEAGEVLKDATATLPGAVFAEPITLDDKGLDVFEWPIHVFIRAPGYQSASVELNQSVHDVTLLHAPHVTLCVSKELAFPPNGSILLALKCQDLNQKSYFNVANAVEVEDGRATVQLEGLGKQTVVIMAMVSNDGNTSTNMSNLKELELDLDADCDGKEVHLALTQEMVNKAFGL